MLRSAAAILPPSTVVTSAVVLSASACARNACATSSALTSRLQQVAAHVVLLGHAARLRALGEEFVGEQAGADAVGIDRIGADAVGAVVDRVLAHQEQRRRLRQPIGAEIRPRVHRLLRHVEQQAAAGALRQHDLHRRLRHALVAVEIQLEALAAASPRRPRRCGPARRRRRSTPRYRRRRRSRRSCRRRR